MAGAGGDENSLLSYEVEAALSANYALLWLAQISDRANKAFSTPPTVHNHQFDEKACLELALVCVETWRGSGGNMR